MRGLWPGGGNEGRPRRSSEDMWYGEDVGGRAEGVWGIRVSYANFARHVRSCRAGGRGVAAAGDRGEGDVGGERTMGVGWVRGLGTVGGVGCERCWLDEGGRRWECG